MKIQTPRVGLELLEIKGFTEWQMEQGEDALLSGFIVQSEEYTEENFYKIDISNAKIERCRFFDCDFEKSSFVDVVFESCDFSNSKFVGAYFSRCEFRNCKCLGTDFHESVMKHVLMKDNLIRYGNFSGTLLENVIMEGCDFTDAAFSNLKYKKWQAQKCLFVGCNFFRTMLRGFDFSENELAEIMVSEGLEELKGCKISPMQALEVAKLLSIQVV